MDLEKIVDVGMRCMVVPLLTMTWIYDAVALVFALIERSDIAVDLGSLSRK